MCRPAFYSLQRSGSSFKSVTETKLLLPNKLLAVETSYCHCPYIILLLVIREALHFQRK